MMRVAVFVGSLRERSINMNLAKALEGLAPEGTKFEYVDIDLPLFNQDLEVSFPVKAKRAKEVVSMADGVLFVTPEYNRSIPGVLKNAIDWISRPYGANSFARKPLGIIGASGSSTGTAFAQSDLRHISAYLDMKQLGQPEVYMANAKDLFDSEGMLIDERWRNNLQEYIRVFADWVENEK